MQAVAEHGLHTNVHNECIPEKSKPGLRRKPGRHKTSETRVSHAGAPTAQQLSCFQAESGGDGGGGGDAGRTLDRSFCDMNGLTIAIMAPIYLPQSHC